jgi:hypothetical protein
MRYRFGRFLQIFGMCILPAGIAGNVLDPEAVPERVMLTFLGIGVGVFLLGYLIQGHKT